jgi:hypothetical protein
MLKQIGFHAKCWKCKVFMLGVDVGTFYFNKSLMHARNWLEYTTLTTPLSSTNCELTSPWSKRKNISNFFLSITYLFMVDYESLKELYFNC